MSELDAVGSSELEQAIIALQEQFAYVIDLIEAERKTPTSKELENV